jgi:hypothetical protein
MQTYELQVGQELVIGGIYLTLLDVEDDHILVQITQDGATYLERMNLLSPKERDRARQVPFLRGEVNPVNSARPGDGVVEGWA